MENFENLENLEKETYIFLREDVFDTKPYLVKLFEYDLLGTLQDLIDRITHISPDTFQNVLYAGDKKRSFGKSINYSSVYDESFEKFKNSISEKSRHQCNFAKLVSSSEPRLQVYYDVNLPKCYLTQNNPLSLNLATKLNLTELLEKYQKSATLRIEDKLVDVNLLELQFGHICTDG